MRHNLAARKRTHGQMDGLCTKFTLDSKQKNTEKGITKSPNHQMFVTLIFEKQFHIFGKVDILTKTLVRYNTLKKYDI